MTILSFMSHTASLMPESGGVLSVGGRLFTMLVSFYALAVAIGWVVGVFIMMPIFDSGAKWFSNSARRYLRLNDSFIGHLLNFVVVMTLFVLVVFTPLCAAFGGLLAIAEGAPFEDGFLHVGGNVVVIALYDMKPKSAGGILLDFISSVIGLGTFSFVVALIGALPFSDRCTDLLGGKREGVLASVKFFFLFFMIIMPVVCAALAVPLGGLLAAAEGWSFFDGWLFAAGIMVQAPGLPPATLEVKQGLGKFVLFVVACWGICISMGWGCGVIVCSNGLDIASKALIGLMDPELRARLETAIEHEVSHVAEAVVEEGRKVAEVLEAAGAALQGGKDEEVLEAAGAALQGGKDEEAAEVAEEVLKGGKDRQAMTLSGSPSDLPPPAPCERSSGEEAEVVDWEKPFQDVMHLEASSRMIAL
eukprot:CAMPEP_0204114316 /NCGR_PEP_ID=MMETSP0361-20130328/4180_1 /ASSEMBLY_ACC=CAM_ASM_000343 /TAXON_ID=268821 /ORGANISM="Scrippsiella Hangoei, Strain SHTV-5" /LENGTH=417 /DNA_ID=CAMNT_0051064833 /DNA_START=89 /DNA_END=1342 /DNA_ORIENTATION=-